MDSVGQLDIIFASVLFACVPMMSLTVKLCGLDVVDYNFSHRIINFSFGEPVAGVVNPLEGDEKLTSDRKSDIAVSSGSVTCLILTLCLH